MSAVGNGIRAVGRGITWPVRATASATGRRPRAVLIALAVVVALLGVLSGVIYQQQHSYDVAEQRRQEALQVAKQQAVALLSYRYQTVQQELAREKRALTGQFKKDYTTLVQKFVAPAAKKQNITTNAKIKAASVMLASSERVKVLLFVNQTIRSKASKQPRVAGSRVTVTLEQVDGRWLVSQLEPV